MSETRVAGRKSVLPAVCDIVLILAFVVIGRGSHDETSGLTGVLATAWPFIAGAAIGWVVMRAWRAPRRVAWTGVGIWLATVVCGLLLRVLSGQGIQPSFMIVTAIVLGIFLLGWRAIAALATRAGAARTVL